MQSRGALLRVASASFDGTVKIWRLADAHLERTLITSQTRMNTVACSSDGALLASSGYDNTIRIWRQSDGTQLFAYDEETGGAGAPGGVTTVMFAPHAGTFSRTQRRHDRRGTWLR